MSKKKESIQNEQFYVKKRGLYRKAEQVVKSCNSDVFVLVHQKDTDKIFSFSSHRNFDLEKISELVLRDVQQGLYLKKNAMYKDTDFDRVKRNVEEMQRYRNMYDANNGPDDMNVCMEDVRETPRHQTYNERDRQFDPLDDTITDEMSMSLQQRTGEATYKTATKPGSTSKFMSPRSNASY